jgi:hypothetical protein
MLKYLFKICSPQHSFQKHRHQDPNPQYGAHTLTLTHNPIFPILPLSKSEFLSLPKAAEGNSALHFSYSQDLFAAVNIRLHLKRYFFHLSVIPAKAGIPFIQYVLDAGSRPA